MLLNEVFDSMIDLQWSVDTNKHRASFTLNDRVYTIHVDEYDLKVSSDTLHLLDVGFTVSVDGSESFESSHLNKHAAKILGYVINNLALKIKELTPDVVLFGAHNKNSDLEARMNIYKRVALWFAKGGGWHIRESMKTPNGEYALLTKSQLSKEDNKIIDKYVEQIPLK